MVRGIVAAVSAAGVGLVAAYAVAATSSVPVESGFEAESPLSAAERELFRQDIEHLQQNFYQASPESRRRWLEAMRERRVLLDQEEDRAAMTQARIKPTRAASTDPARPPASRQPVRDRSAD